jgi:hypothetical protein
MSGEVTRGAAQMPATTIAKCAMLLLLSEMSADHYPLFCNGARGRWSNISRGGALGASLAWGSADWRHSKLAELPAISSVIKH